MPLTPRSQIYSVLDQERQYQDSKWPEGVRHTPIEALRIIQGIIQEANATWYKEPNNLVVDGEKILSTDLHAMRKIAATCIRCMERFGALPRKTSLHE